MLFGWSGEVRFPGFGSGRITTGELTSALERELARHEPTTLEVAQDSVAFSAGPLRFVANFNVLAPINHGVIRIDQHSPDLVLHYRISFAHVFVIATAVLGTLFFMEAFVLRDFGTVEAAVGLALMWIWLCGGNVLLGVYRFRALLRHALIPPLARATRDGHRTA
jgi:hypothetical protein